MKNLYLALLATALTPSFLFAQDETRKYVAAFTSTPPTIDGMLTGESEWAQGESASGDWSMIGGGLADLTNNRFNVLWDDTGMYLRHQVDYNNWPDPPIGTGSVQFLYDSLNLYFDPNKDNETNDNFAPDDSGVDGYVIAINQPLGFSERTPDNPQLGIFEQAHVNSLFGNQHLFAGFPGIQIAQTTSSTESFGYTEMFIPWEDFNSSDPAVWDEATEDTGLFHNHAPLDGEEWFFNIARIENGGNTIPSWVSTPGITLLPARPHGILQFSQGSVDPGDVNGDGVCDALDIDAVAKAVREEQTDPVYDVDVDGDVDLADHQYMVEVLHDTFFGDSNLDFEFNTSDLVAVFTQGQYEDDEALNSLWATGDWNGDGDFNTSDFVKAFTSGGYEKGRRSDMVAAVPEPSAVLLLIIGLVCFVSRRRA